MNYLKIDKASVADGIGFRTVLYVAGCDNACKGCHNPASWDFDAGKPFDDTAKSRLFSCLEKPYIRGITVTGGDPMHQKNQEDVRALLKEVKSLFPQKDVWLYTGYTLPERMNIGDVQEDIVSSCDVIVDGLFVGAEKDLTIPFRGSRNQRVIYIPNSYIENGTYHWHILTDEEVRKGEIFAKR